MQSSRWWWLRKVSPPHSLLVGSLARAGSHNIIRGRTYCVSTSPYQVMIINNPGPFPAQGRHLHPCSHKFKSHILFSTLSKKKTAIQTNSLRILAPFHACVVNWSSIMTIELHFFHLDFWALVVCLLANDFSRYEDTLYSIFWGHSV